MKIKMLTMECGPNGNFPIGSVRDDVPDDIGLAMVAGGYAIDITPKETAVMPAPEVTEPEAPEISAPPAPEERTKRPYNKRS